MIISHNSMSYLKVRNPLMWLPNLLVAKCQRKDVYTQLNECDGIDIRVYFHNGEIRYAHGLVNYKYNDNNLSFFSLLKYINSNYKGKIVRVLLEKVKDECDVHQFISLCLDIESRFTNIIFIGGYRKTPWDLIYKFEHTGTYHETQYISSVKGKCIFRISPILYYLFYGWRANRAFINRKEYRLDTTDIVDFV